MQVEVVEVEHIDLGESHSEDESEVSKLGLHSTYMYPHGLCYRRRT